MKVTIFCSDPKHPVWVGLAGYCARNGFFLTHLASRLTGGDFLFLVSCNQFVDRETRDKYGQVIVLHESALPKGRGWSPVAHQIIDGSELIIVSAIIAEDKIDSGDILAQESAFIHKHFLSDEIMARIFAAKKLLIERVLSGNVVKRAQAGEPTYYKKRTPADCELDVNKSIKDQFDLLRICEPRFPAFFNLHGHKYILEVRKA